MRALLFALLPVAAQAQTVPCLPLPLVAQIAEENGSSPAVRASLIDGGTVIVWANAETGSWTLTVTRPDGITCLIGAGIGIETVAARLPPNI